jgi:hypothetical protein
VRRISGQITEEGDISSEFTVEVVNVSFLTESSIHCAIDKDGFDVLDARVVGEFGNEDDRAWGTIGASYSRGDGFELSGAANVRLTDDLVASGEFDYNTRERQLSAKLEVEDIELFNMTEDLKLFELTKKIPVFAVTGAGMYLDLGLDIEFGYGMALTLSPEVSLEGLDLRDFSFERAEGIIGLGGKLEASLETTPAIGAGIFAVSTRLLSGGGGLKFKVAAASALDLDSDLRVGFTQQGDLDGDAKVAMPLTFGIDAELLPYFTLDVLSGVYQYSWDGGPLQRFEILPETELFNFTLDIGGDLSEQQPELPSAPVEPTEPEADKVLEQKTPTEEDTEVEKPEELSGEKSEENVEDEGGFSLRTLFEKLLGHEKLQGLRNVIESAGEAWEKIQNFFGSVVGFIRNFVGEAVDVMMEVLDGIAEHGVFGYLQILLKERLGDTAYFIIEPLLTELTESEARILAIFSREPPSGNMFGWVFGVLVDFFGVAFGSLSGLVRAVDKMWENGKTVAVRSLNTLIQEGRLGVRRHRYYVGAWKARKDFLAATEYKIYIPGFISVHDKAAGRTLIGSSSAVAYPLWCALEKVHGVPPTNTSIDRDSGSPFNDYWVGGTSPPQPELGQESSFIRRYRELIEEILQRGGDPDEVPVPSG